MSGTIIVVEKQARWFPEMLRQFAGCAERVVLDASASELRKLIADNKPQQSRLVAIFDLSTTVSPILQHLRNARDPNLMTIAVAPPEVAVLEPTLRELGLTSFHVLPLDGLSLANECRRLLNIQRKA